MNDPVLTVPDDEAKALYRLLHHLPEGQDTYCETYRQLQAWFFRTMTVEELTTLLGGDR